MRLRLQDQLGMCLLRSSTVIAVGEFSDEDWGISMEAAGELTQRYPPPQLARTHALNFVVVFLISIITPLKNSVRSSTINARRSS